MAVPRNPVTIDTSDTFSTWLSNTNLAINVLKDIITDTILTHPSASAFTVGSTITQGSATGIVLAGRLASSVKKQFILAIPSGKSSVDYLALDWWKA